MNTELTLIGESPIIKRLRKEIPKYATMQRHLLLVGERGVGKSIVAKLINKASKTKGTLITLNPLTCSDGELKEILDTSTSGVSMILIQEVEGFSFLSQASIAKFVDQMPKKSFVQVIITAKKSLGEMVKDNLLIDSLGESLKSFELIAISSLTQRREDIPLLVEYFLKNGCERLGLKLKTIDINALDFLARRDWRENVNELRAVVERALVASDQDVIELPQYLIDEYIQLEGMVANIDRKQTFSFDKSLSNLEKTLIERALDAVGYNQTRAAEVLGISEANLRYRLKKFHILPSRKHWQKL